MIKNRTRPLGFTLLDLMLTVIILGILFAILYPLLQYWLGLLRLNIAISTLAQHWKMTRYDATGSGETPLTLCMTDNSEGLFFSQIHGNDCDKVTSWRTLTSGVSIDRDNSTLRTESAVAGNGGTIYRVSWADTNGGLGGSWGQLGRLVLLADGTTAKKCLFLFNTNGDWNIRENHQCNRS